LWDCAKLITALLFAKKFKSEETSKGFDAILLNSGA
jgi:hypothetical protein